MIALPVNSILPVHLTLGVLLFRTALNIDVKPHLAR